MQLQFQVTKSSNLIDAKATINQTIRNYKSIAMASIPDCAWTAGIIDGEGHVTITSNKRNSNNGRRESFSISLRVSNTDIRLMQKLINIWGGKIIHRKHTNGKGWKDCYEWIVCSFSAYDILKQIKPYLIIKQEQADLCLELQDKIITFGASKLRLVSDIEYEARLNLRNQIMILNARGQESIQAKANLLQLVRNNGELNK